MLGVAVAACLWWQYSTSSPWSPNGACTTPSRGASANEVARDSYSLLHFPMIAGIVLTALGVKNTLGHGEDPLKLVPAVALMGGSALYLPAHVAFRWRTIHRLSVQRIAAAAVLLALIPAALELPALLTLAILAAILSALIVYEVIRFAEFRDRLRHQVYQPV